MHFGRNLVGRWMPHHGAPHVFAEHEAGENREPLMIVLAIEAVVCIGLAAIALNMS